MAGVAAVVDLALNELPAQVPRELSYQRFPLVDGAGNPPWLLRAAVDAVAGLVRSGTPTLVFCAAGMCRSPAIAAAALARANGGTPADALALVTQSGPCDVSPALWNDLLSALAQPTPSGSGSETSVRTGYDRWAEVYDHDLNPLIGLEEPHVHAALGDVRGRSVLDLGCGTGRHALWLATAGADVTAVDFSEGMLAEAHRKPGADTVRFLAHDLHEPLPFADATFDRVVSGLVLEHLRDLSAFFREMRRVVKPSGVAVVSAMHPAMMLRGSQARFTDPASGEVVAVGSEPHTLGAFVMAAVRSGFRLDDVVEAAPDAAFAERFPRAAKYVGWPMLVVLRLAAGRQSEPEA